jgi:OPA family glycerol-3-phosphate transporter-like MFS transporter
MRSTAATHETGKWTPRRVGLCATQLFLYCFLAYTCSYLGRKNFSACIPAMVEEAFLTNTLGGTVNSAYMLAYGAGQMLSGIIGTRVKPRYMIGTGLCGAGLCNLAMGLVPVAGVMPVIWALNGLFHSMLWAPIIRTFTDLLPAGRREKAGTNIAASCSVGAVLAFLIPGVILKYGGWRTVFYISGGVLLTCFVIWVAGNRVLSGYIRMMEEATRLERAAILEKAESRTAAEGAPPRVKRSLPAVMLASGLWVVLFGLVCNGALRDAVESWAPTFLKSQFGLDSSTAAIISVIIPIVSISGTYVANWLHERFLRNELRTAACMFAVAALCVAGLFLCRNANALLCAVFMAVAISAMWGANHMFLTVVPYHFAPLGVTAAVTGLLNSVIYFATALCAALYGILSDTLGWSVMILVWMGIGTAGTLCCLIFAGFWGKKRVALDEGRI